MANEKREGRMPVKEYFALGEVFGYWFRKKDPNRPNNFSIRSMHTINKISMLMFLVCLLVMAYRFFIR